jgi:hypothetical protein
MPTDRVNLVHEDDARRVALGLVEQIAHAAVMQKHRFFAAEECFIVATAEVVNVTIVWLDDNFLDVWFLDLRGMQDFGQRERMAGLADNQIPCLASREWFVSDDPSTFQLNFTDTGFDAVHRAQPSRSGGLAPCDRGRSRFRVEELKESRPRPSAGQ